MFPSGVRADARCAFLPVLQILQCRHFSGRVLEFLTKVIRVLNGGNHDNSDAMVDYFDVGWYVDVRFGRWKNPYKISGVK